MNITLTMVDFVAISPLIILLAGALVLLLLETFYEVSAKRISFYVVLGFIIFALYAAVEAPASQNPLLTSWLRFDSLGRVFTVFFLLIGLASTLLSFSFFRSFEATKGEYFFLLLSSLFGLILVGTAADFITLFLGLETLSIALYVLCGYMKKWKISHEGSMKYFFTGAIAAAFLLYGIALIYGATGTTRFDQLLSAYNGISTTSGKTLFFSGIALVTLGLAFKAAIVPFHVWAPDVYEGAPTPVTAFMAVGTKVGAFAAFIRVFLDALPNFSSLWSEGVIWLIYFTLIYANFVALRQFQLRRFFAYSGISHAGFLLIPIVVGTSQAVPALMFYISIYALATFGCFAVLAFIDNKSEGVMIHDLQGLFRRSPFLAGVFSLCLLTLAGLPPTAGFIAKFYLFKLAFQAEYYSLVVIGLLATILSAYYYTRIITVMFSESPRDVTSLQRSWPAATLGIFSCIAIAVLSFYPSLMFV